MYRNKKLWRRIKITSYTTDWRTTTCWTLDECCHLSPRVQAFHQKQIFNILSGIYHFSDDFQMHSNTMRCMEDCRINGRMAISGITDDDHKSISRLDDFSKAVENLVDDVDRRQKHTNRRRRQRVSSDETRDNEVTMESRRHTNAWVIQNLILNSNYSVVDMQFNLTHWCTVSNWIQNIWQFVSFFVHCLLTHVAIFYDTLYYLAVHTHAHTQASKVLIEVVKKNMSFQVCG